MRILINTALGSLWLPIVSYDGHGCDIPTKRAAVRNTGQPGLGATCHT